jgi:polysaccharide biosynthesis protein PslE
MSNQGPNKSEPAHFSVRDAVAALFRHKLLICLTFLTVVFGAAVVSYLLPNQYDSRMKILVKNTRSDVPITPGPTSGASGNSLDNDVSETQINSEIELLTSKDLLTKVASECGLYQRPPSLLERVGIKKSSPSVPAQIEAAANSLATDLVVSPVKKTNIIEIKYTSHSPELAAKVLRTLQDLYLEKHLRLHRPPGTYEFFKAQAEQYEGQLREAEKHFSTFQQTMNVVSLAQQKEQAVQKLTESKSKLLETEAFLREVNDRIGKVQQQLALLQPRIVTQSRALPNQYSAERLNTMLVELQNRRTQLLSKFRPEDRLVREVDQQIKTTRGALQQATDAVATEQSTGPNPLRQTLETELARAKVDQAGALGRREMIAGQVQQYEAQLSRLEGITAEYEDLTRKVRQSADNYELYTKKEEEARITDELDQNKITNVSIAEAPAQPQIPSKPNRPLNLLLGVFLGAVFSVAGVIAAESMRDTVETPRELEALMDQRVVASLPRGTRQVHHVLREKKQLSPPKPASEPDLRWADEQN